MHAVRDEKISLNYLILRYCKLPPVKLEALHIALQLLAGLHVSDHSPVSVGMVVALLLRSTSLSDWRCKSPFKLRAVHVLCAYWLERCDIFTAIRQSVQRYKGRHCFCCLFAG